MAEFIEPFSTCPLSGLAIRNFQQNDDVVYYFVDVRTKEMPLRLSKETIRELQKLQPILPDIGVVIRTGNWPFVVGHDPDIVPQMLTDLIVSPKYPKHPEDSLKLLFDTLYQRQEKRGGWVEIFDQAKTIDFAHALYLESLEEMVLYFRELESLGWIEATFNNPANDNGTGLPINYRLTFKGLKLYRDMQEVGSTSRNCFIAMSFGTDPMLTTIRSTIKDVLTALRYQPQIVDETHLNSDQTINDGIIALIKKSKFAVCDFTEQKYGVYFEAGYACGRGLPVIYTCHDEWKDKLHFDTNHFPHIFYKDTEELRKKLKDKIEAWIE